MKKRMLSLLLALCMVLGMLPVSALAAEIPDGMNIAQISDVESITAGDEITFSLWGMDGYSAPSYIAVVPAGTQSVTVSFQEGTICDPYEDYNTGELKLSGCMVTYDQENDAYVGSGTESSCDNSSGLNTIVLDVEAMIAEGKYYGAYDSSYSVLYLLGFRYEEAAECEHDWKDATCTEPKTCSVCGETEGDALGHSYESGVCTVCGAKAPTVIYSGTGEPHTQCYISQISMNGVEVDSVTADGTNINVVLDPTTALDQEIEFEFTLRGRYLLYLYYKEASETSYANKVIISKPATSAVPSTGTLNYNLTDGALELTLKATHSQSTTYWNITVTIAEEHTCTFDQEVVSEDYLASAATCTEAATYYYSCACGEKDTETFTSGEALGHDHVDGVCTVCGAADPDYITTSDAKIYIRSGNSSTGYTYTDVAELGETGLVLNNYSLTLWSYQAYLVVKDADGNNIEAEWSIDNTDAADVKDYSGYTNYETGMTWISALGKASGQTGTIAATLEDGTVLTLKVTATRFPKYITYTGLEGEDGNTLFNQGWLKEGKCFIIANPGDEFVPVTAFKDASYNALTEEEMGYMTVKLNSDNETVAKVVDGKIQVVGEGTCNIWVSVTAYDSGILKEGGNTLQNANFYHIVVYSGDDLLKRVSFADTDGNALSEMTVTEGESEIAVLKLEPENAENYLIEASSGDTAVATVVLNENNTVTVTGIAEGEVKIKVAYCAGSNPIGVSTKFYNTVYLTVKVEPSSHICEFVREDTAEGYLASEATCTEAATYYYSCECGKVGTETFSYGDALGHTYVAGICTVCGAEDPDYVASGAETPFLSIVTNEGKDVTATFVKMIPAATEWAAYDDGPYYNVTVPAGTISVLVTYPADVDILNDGNGTAWSYTLSVPDYVLGYGSETFTLTANDDGTNTVEIPIANYMLAEDGTGTAMSLEKSETYDPVTFFTFEYEAEDSSDETEDSVTVYFSVSHDAEFAEGEVTGEIMALKEITVPYFDLALYGLEQYYFSSESYGDDGDGQPGSDLAPGTAEYADGKVTMLHLFIYAVEVYHCGVDPDEAGQGYLYDENLLGTEILNISGSQGSSFLNYFWGYDLNLNYYLNYEYPLASEGWGSTSDQILLEDGDIVTLGHFSSWSFFNDSTSIFNYMADGAVVGATTANRGDQIELTLYRAGSGIGNDYTTAHTIVDYCPEVYYAPVDDIPSSNVTRWTYLGTAESDGTIVVDTSAMAAGQYIIAMAGQYGAENTEEICSTPGGILLTVEASEEPEVEYQLGDVNMDGVIDTQDANLVVSAYYGSEELTEEQLKLADVDGNGVIDTQDANLIVSYYYGTIDTFPAEG